MVLDLTPGKLSDAIEHAQKALDSVNARLEVLKTRLPNAPEKAEPAAHDEKQSERQQSEPSSDAKGKGKEVRGSAGRNLYSFIPPESIRDDIDRLDRSKIETQIKEFDELRGDLEAKVSTRSRSDSSFVNVARGMS